MTRKVYYPLKVKTPKRLFLLGIKFWWPTFSRIFPTLPFIFFFSFLVHGAPDWIQASTLRLLLELLSVVLPLFSLFVSISLADAKLRGDASSSLKEVAVQVKQRCVELYALSLAYISLTLLYFLLVMGLQHLSVAFSFGQGLRIAKNILILALALGYLYALVVSFMGFLGMLLDALPWRKAIGESIRIVTPHWVSAFTVYAGFFLIFGILFFPRHLQFLPFLLSASKIEIFIFQLAWVAVMVPFWVAWYLATYHDLKLRTPA